MCNQLPAALPGGRLLAVLTAAAALFLPALGPGEPAHAATSAAAAGRVLLALDGPGGRQLRAAGLELGAQGGGAAPSFSARRLGLGVRAAAVGRRAAVLHLSGRLVLRAPRGRLVLRAVRLRIARRGALSARLGARRVVLARFAVPAPGRRLDRASGSVSLGSVQARIGGTFAAVLATRLGLAPASRRLGSLRAAVEGVDDVPVGGMVRWGFAESLRARVYAAAADRSRPPILATDTAYCDTDIDPDPTHTPGCDPALRRADGLLPAASVYFPVNELSGGPRHARVRAQGGIEFLDQGRGARLLIANPVFRIRTQRVLVGAFVSVDPEPGSAVAPLPETWLELGSLPLAEKPTKRKEGILSWRTKSAPVGADAMAALSGMLDPGTRLDPIVIAGER